MLAKFQPRLVETELSIEAGSYLWLRAELVKERAVSTCSAGTDNLETKLLGSLIAQGNVAFRLG